MRGPIPLQQINAFEAAAQDLSFSRAAKKLNVLQPAISRQVAALEEALETKLFLRTKPQLSLTEDGETLKEAVFQGFEAIRNGIDIIRDRNEVETIVVTASIGFASLYLLPRLADFQAMHPDVKLQIVTQDQNPDINHKKSDVVIAFGDFGVSDDNKRKIFSEKMVAVCHPKLLPEGKALSRQVLAQQELLYLSDRDHNDDWNRFLQGSGAKPPQPSTHRSYVSYMVYLRAIQNGLGIGIGWHTLLEEFLQNGSLVMACVHELDTQRGYFCSIDTEHMEKRGTRQFLDWVTKA